MSVTSVQDLLDDGALIATDTTLRLADVVGPGEAYGDNVALRLSHSSMEFSGSGGTLTARAHFVGSASPSTGTWLWGWTNVNGFPDDVCAQSRAMREFGEQYAIADLTTAEIPLVGDAHATAGRFAVIGTLIGGRLPAYITDVGGGTIAVFLIDHPEVALQPLSTPRLMSVLHATASEGQVRDWPRALRQYAAFRGLTVAGDLNAPVVSGPTIDDVRLQLDGQGRLTGVSGSVTAAGTSAPPASPSPPPAPTPSPSPSPPPAPAPSPSTSPGLDLRRPGVGYADVVTPDDVDAAVAAGRLEWFWLTSPRFGGPESPQNRLPGPVGVGAAREWIDDQIVAVLERGGEVSASADIEYDDGDSRVPRTVRYDLGPELGVHTLTFW